MSVSFSRPTIDSFESTGAQRVEAAGLRRRDDVEHDRAVRRELHALRVRHARHQQRRRGCPARARAARRKARGAGRSRGCDARPARSVAASRDDAVIDDRSRPFGRHRLRRMGRRARRCSSSEHLVFTPELPGFGSTPEQSGELSLAEYVLSAFDGAAALVGTSFGGRAVLETALAAPERVTQLVLIDANPFGWSDDVQQRAVAGGGAVRRRPARRRGRADGARRGSSAPSASRTGGRRAVRARVRGWCCAATSCRRRTSRRCGASRSSRRASPRRRSSSAARSTGRTSPPRRSVSSSEMPNAREVVVEAAAHLPTLERPDEVARLILDFVSEYAPCRLTWSMTVRRPRTGLRSSRA